MRLSLLVKVFVILYRDNFRQYHVEDPKDIIFFYFEGDPIYDTEGEGEIEIDEIINYEELNLEYFIEESNVSSIE